MVQEFERVTIKQMREEDIATVREIEKQCFKDLWPSDSFERELENKRVAFYITARHSGKIVGYMGAWLIMDEIHITTIGVDPSFQNRKVGTQLVMHLLRESVHRGVRWATLEVGERNVSALKLYGKFGFIQIGVRKEYYKDGENALVMWAGRLQNDSYKERLGRLEAELNAAAER
jgi:[ribosomal protein S18]-alanine N-acetyltransferase